MLPVLGTLDELTQHAATLASTPFPISEWRPGDGPDDERWRALTEIERREVLALVSGYENLIAWSEVACGVFESAEEAEAGNGRDTLPSEGRAPSGRCDAATYLETQRVRLGRFRKEMTFLERRRHIS